MRTLPLRDLAFARSGDKGDVCTIGLLAKGAEEFEIVRRQVTPERVKAFFGPMAAGPVEIYPLPSIHALEVVIRQALGGGATRTLRFDQTGKAMGTALLRLDISVE